MISINTPLFGQIKQRSRFVLSEKWCVYAHHCPCWPNVMRRSLHGIAVSLEFTRVVSTLVPHCVSLKSDRNHCKTETDNQRKSTQMLVFEARRKPEYPEKNLLGKSREPTNSAHIWCRSGNRTRATLVYLIKRFLRFNVFKTLPQDSLPKQRREITSRLFLGNCIGWLLINALFSRCLYSLIRLYMDFLRSTFQTCLL